MKINFKVDEIYNHKTKLYITAEKELLELFENPFVGEATDEVFALERCKSRLTEMQSKKYMEEPSYFDINSSF